MKGLLFLWLLMGLVGGAIEIRLEMKDQETQAMGPIPVLMAAPIFFAVFGALGPFGLLIAVYNSFF